MPTDLAPDIDPLDYLDLVYKIANRYRRCRMDIDDLLSAGKAGLMEAAKKFDIGRGTSFRTFASHRIRGAIVNAIRDEGLPIRVPRGHHASCRDGPDCEAGPIDSGIHTCADDARRVFRATFLGDSQLEHGSLADIVEDHHDDADSLEMAWTAGMFVDELPEEEAAIIESLFGLNDSQVKSPEAIARERGLTLEEVVEIAEQAKEKLRLRMEDDEHPPAPEHLGRTQPREEPPAMKGKSRLHDLVNSQSTNGRAPKSNSKAKVSKGSCPACGTKYGGARRCYNKHCEKYSLVKHNAAVPSDKASVETTSVQIVATPAADLMLTLMQETQAMNTIGATLASLSPVLLNRILDWVDRVFRPAK